VRADDEGGARMTIFVGSMVLTVVCYLFYHLSSKSIPADLNPIVSLIVTYGVALVVGLLLLPVYPSTTPVAKSLHQVNWASVLMGLAIFGIEMGYLYAYRSGWHINVAGAVSNVAVAVLLVPVGFLLFKEGLTATKVVGLVLCIAGMIVVNI
jgi:drug/metabolite transporter (DMT)-like permease